MLIKLGNDCEIKKQIEEVEKLVSECGAKTIDELLDLAILSTANYDGDLVDFNYKDIEGTIYEFCGKLVIGDSFGLWDTDNCVFKGNFMRLELEHRLNKLHERLKETDSESAYILEDIMKEL